MWYTLLHALVYWRLKPLRSSRCMIIASRFIMIQGVRETHLHWYSIQDLICKFYDALKPNYQKLTSNYMQFYWTVIIIIMVFWDYGDVLYIRYLYTTVLYIMVYIGSCSCNSNKMQVTIFAFLYCVEKYRQFIALATERFFLKPQKVLKNFAV
jgi:hypothetical protein